MFKNLSTISRQVSFVLFFLLLLAFAWRISLGSLDPDLGWHLKFGQDIAQTGKLPHDQIHLWTINGSWVDHEWLTNWVMFLVYDKTNYTGLTFAFSLITVICLWLIARHLRQKSWSSDIFIMLLMTAGFLGIAPHLGPRPQLISFLFLALEILFLKKLGEKQDWRAGFGLVLFFWFWTCLHAGFAIGLAILGLWTTQKIWESFKQKSWRQAIFPVVLGLGAVGATLATPYGFKLYDFLATYQNNAYLKHISEWKAIWIFPIHYWQLLYLAIILAFAIVVFIFKPKTKIQPWLIAASLMFLVMALKSVRHFPLFLVCSTLTLIPEFIETNFSKKINQKTSRWWQKFIQILLPLTLFFVVWLTFFATVYISDPFQKFCDNYPCQTGRVLKLHPRYSQLKILNRYEYGGWLIWVWPEKKLFIDGRLPQYPFNGRSLLEEYLDFNNPNKVAEKLKEHGIEAVLWTNHQTIYKLNWLDKLLGFREKDINSRTDEVKKYLDNSPEWKETFSDEAGVIYIRKDKY
jgi:hypothetical protein